MCGIAGFVDTTLATPAERLDEIAAAMSDSLAHRGPDDSGTWVDPACGVALGHRRLSIIDLSPLGHQPMCSADGRFVVTYNGEIYNYKELRNQLERLGHRFRGGSDTEVLVEATAAWGVRGAAERFNGMFAMAVWDREKRVLSLLRDRFGEKPLYYGWAGRNFVFGSELKALRRHPDFRVDVDRGSLAQFLRYQYIPAPGSIFRGISKLKAGHLVELPLGAGPERRQEPYWSMHEVALAGLAHPLHPTEIVDALDASVRESISLRMVADVPLGAFLSGGIDSSAVVAVMQQLQHRAVKTFTIGFHESEYDEAQHAAAVAAHLGTEHTELYVTPGEALAVIPRLSEMYDEPFGDSSQIPTALLSALTRDHVTVALSGDGGDELFVGYDRYEKARRLIRRPQRIPSGVRRALAKRIREWDPAQWTGLSRRLRRFAPRLANERFGHRAHAVADILDSDLHALYLRMMSHWSDPLEVVLDAEEPLTPLNNPEEWGGFPGANENEEMSYLDLLTYLPDGILAKVDRASMAVSLEVRVPLLDPNVVALAWRIPPAHKTREGRSKWPLRQMLDRYVPAALVERPKMGFGVPIDHWLRGPLRDWAEALLAERRLADEGFLDPAPIRRAWEQHRDGTADLHYPLWDVLMFQAWLETTTTRVSKPEHGRPRVQARGAE